MRLFKVFLVVLASLLALAGMAQTRYVPGEVLVGLRPDYLGRRLPQTPLVGTVKDTLGKDKVLRIRTPRGTTDAQLLDYYRRRPDVLFAERNAYKERAYTPNDPRYAEQWALPRINAERAWDFAQGDASVVVAIIDDGVQSDHPDLQNKLVPGWDISDNDPDTNPSPYSSHGTHCAGIAGAETNNATGIASIGHRIKIMPMKIWPNATDFTSAQAIRYAADHGARIISMSYGSSNLSLTEQMAVDYAWGRGCLLVGAAGNNGYFARFYPAAHANVIAVASSEPDDTRSMFSNYSAPNDPWVEVAAPGSNILSTVPQGSGYANSSGTSMATPLVAGLLGLMVSVDPNATNVQLRERLKTSSKNVGAWVSAGRIDAEQAVKSMMRKLYGTLALEGFTGDPRTLQINAHFVKADGTTADIQPLTLDLFGHYTVYTNAPAGTYTVRFHASRRFLRKAVQNVTLTDSHLLDAALANGDANGDNRVNSTDLLMIRRSFGSTSSSPNWNPQAEMNGDNAVNSTDLLIVRQNFGAQGD